MNASSQQLQIAYWKVNIEFDREYAQRKFLVYAR